MDTRPLLLDTAHFPRYISSGYRTFDAGKRHVNRTIPITVLVMVLEGELFYEMDGETGSVREGEWILEPPLAVMRGSRPCDRSLRFFYTHFEPLPRSDTSFGMTIDEAGDYDTPARARLNLPLRGTFETDRFVPLFDRMSAAARVFPNDFLYRQGVFLELLSALSDVSKPSLPEKERLASEVYDYLTASCADAITGKDLEKRFNFSADYLSRLLKTYYGASMKELLLRFRINLAKDLLGQTVLTVEEIAEETGFSDVGELYKHFRALTGTTPGQFRKDLR